MESCRKLSALINSKWKSNELQNDLGRDSQKTFSNYQRNKQFR